MARRRPKSSPPKAPASPKGAAPPKGAAAKGRGPKSEELGRRVAEGPNGPIHELLVDGAVVGWIEHATDSLAVAALQARAERLATLRHPFLSRTQGLRTVGEAQGLLTDASEAIDLAELCLAGPVPAAAAVDLFRKVARALHAGWDLQTRKQPAAGLIHGCLDARDIWVDASGGVRLNGLGLLAPGGGQEGSHPATARGESQATAPERLRGEPPLPAGDVYSLGAWLVRALSGQDAPWASSSAAWQEATAASAVQQVLEHTGERALGELVGQMLAFDPAERPSALAVEQQLDRLRKTQDRDALSRWAAEVVPSARGSIEVRQGFEQQAVAQAGPAVDDEEPTAEVEPISTEYADFVEGADPSGLDDGSGAGDASLSEPPRDSMAARRLWEIRGPTEPGGPSRILEWGEPSPPEPGPGDPSLLRDELDEVPTDNSGEILDLGTGRFVVGEGGLKALEDDEKLGVAVLPGAGAAAKADPAPRPEPAANGSSAERPPRVPSAPPVPSAPLAGAVSSAGAASPAPGSASPAASAATPAPGAPSPAPGAASPAPRAAPARPPRPPAARRPSPPPAPLPAEEPTDWTWLAAAARAVAVVLGLLWWAWASPGDRAEATVSAPVPAESPPQPLAPSPAPTPEPPTPEPPSPEPPAPAPEPPAPAPEPPAPAPEPPASAPEPAPKPTPPEPAPKPPAAEPAPKPTPPASTARTPAASPPKVDPTVPPPPIPVREAPASLASPASPASPTGPGQLTIKGDASRIRLSGSGGSYTAAGELPAGAYEVTAWFGETAVEVGRLVVVSGQTHTVDCKSAFVRCSLR